MADPLNEKGVVELEQQDEEQKARTTSASLGTHANQVHQQIIKQSGTHRKTTWHGSNAKRAPIKFG